VQAVLKRSVSRLLKVKTEDIDADTELIEYGFDSITLTEFSNTINQEYKLELTPTIFFEHPTIRSSADYLLKEHRDIIVSRFAVPMRTGRPVEPKESKVEAIPSPQRQRSRFITEAAKSKHSTSPAIAVVGMSGRFPMAEDLNEFWKNLFEGQ